MDVESRLTWIWNEATSHRRSWDSRSSIGCMKIHKLITEIQKDVEHATSHTNRRLSFLSFTAFFKNQLVPVGRAAQKRLFCRPLYAVWRIMEVHFCWQLIQLFGLAQWDSYQLLWHSYPFALYCVRCGMKWNDVECIRTFFALKHLQVVSKLTDCTHQFPCH